MTSGEKTILVVEDSEDIRKFACRVLDLEGYRVLQSGNGTEAMRLLQDTPVNLAIIDLLLPGHNGWTILEQVKSNPRLSGVKVIVFSALAELEQKEKALQKGAIDYLVKPLSANSLRNAAIRALQ